MNQQLPAEPAPRPDRRLEGHDAMGRKIAGCSLWWSEPLMVNGHPAGLIGHYAAETPEAGCALLQQALQELRDHGCALAVGPMDGNTWGNYRFVTGGSGEPPFFLEPDHPPEWPAHFRAVGFTPLARYHSTITDHLDEPDPKADRAQARLEASGCMIRPLDASRLDDDMKSIHHLSLSAFQSAFLYQPIPFDAFAAAQARLIPLLRPDLVLLAERRGEPVGFVFAIPDVLQAGRGVPVDTVIIKSLAVLPGRDQAGLGVCLVRRIHQTAHELGYSRVIHALMHEANTSLNIHRSASHPLREYTLFCRTL
jgi:GNAT superfamily N-acetyltransferase